MSDSPTTSMIARFPAEIRDAISNLLDKKGLDSLTRLSKLCRSLFAPSLFKQIRVEDSERHVSRLLEALPSGQLPSQMVNVWAYTTHATITLFPNGRPSSSTAWRKASDRYIPKDEEIPKRIIQCIRLMTSLRVLSIDIQPFSSEQGQIFVRLLEESITWEISHLRVAVPSSLALDIIGNCCPETLVSLQVSNGMGVNACRGADELCSRLKRLHVFQSAHYDLAGKPYPNVCSIAERFPCLEWFVIYTSRADCLLTLTTAEEKAFFEENLYNFTESLKALRKLKRFGMLIPSVRYRPHSPRTSNPVSQRRQLAAPNDPASWYFELIGQMGRILPSVHEICLMGMYPELYRGTRLEDSVEMTFQEEDARHVDRYKFPIGLVY